MGPAAVPHVDGVPSPVPGWQRSPFAALFEYVEDAVDGVEVGHFDVAALFGERVCYLFVLFLCQFHMLIVLCGYPDSQHLE